MESEFANVNWLAVIAGTIAAFLVGWLWYSEKLFGKGWAAGSGVELGSADQMPVFAMVSQLVGLFVLALLVGVTATTNALMTAILGILAVALLNVSAGAFVRKSNYALGVDFGYLIIAGALMILAQGLL